MASYDYTFKIMVLGDADTPKTSLINRYISGFYLEDLKLTIGADFSSKTTLYKGKKVKLQIWDFDGEKRFRSLLHQYIKGTDAVLLLYNITNPSTFEHLPDWIRIVRENAGDIPIILVGAKAHLEQFRAVSKEEGILAAKKYNLSSFIEVSAKTGKNFDQLFEDVIEKSILNVNKRRLKPKKVGKKRKNSNILNKLLGAIPEVKSAAIVSAEGLPIASALPQGVDETKIAAMTAALLSLSEMAILEMGKGDFDQLYVKGSEGYFLVMQAGREAVLAVSTTKDVRLGLVLLDSRRTCERISGLLDKYGDDDDDDEDRFPYPYIFKPPEPPGDLEMAVQLQVKKSKNKETENDIFCQYCGRKLKEEENISHNCKESPK